MEQPSIPTGSAPTIWYFKWRELLITCTFNRQRFGPETSQESVCKLLNKVQEAERVTWADGQINDKMKLLTSYPKKGKKTPKKASKKRCA